MNNQIIIINKPSGYSSRDIVNLVCKKIGTKKVGHTGTLDPMATGVLVIVAGKYTKLVDLISSLEKEYIATIKLGIKTDTLDITGNMLEYQSDYNIREADVKKVLDSFLGSYNQTVPIYSAVHVNGKRLYEYAKNNEKVLLPTRNVEIKAIKLLDLKDDLIKFKVKVSKGTYIRSLINDICNKLGVIGTMSELVRTKQGKFNIEDAYTLEEFACDNYEVISLEKVLNAQIIEVTDDLYKKVINGNKLELNYNGFVIFEKNNNKLALYNFENNVGKLKILF